MMAAMKLSERQREQRLANEYAHATCCNLATLEMLCERKGSSKSSIERQRRICERMLRTCQEHEEAIDFGPENHLNYPRVKLLLDTMRTRDDEPGVYGMDVTIGGERNAADSVIESLRIEASRLRGRAADLDRVAGEIAGAVGGLP